MENLSNERYPVLGVNLKRVVEGFIFNSKWLLVVFIFGLIVSLGVYAFVYVKEIFHMLHTVKYATRGSILLYVLENVDMAMVATLVSLIVTGSYDTFISRKHTHSHENVSSGQLKIKLAAALLGISSIHLFQSFNSAERVNWDVLHKQMSIHGIFLVGLIILAITEHIHVKDKKIHHDMTKEH